MGVPTTASGEMEHALINIWIHITPLVLVLATVVLFVRLITGKRYRSRMSRASFILLLSYAVLMVRVLIGAYNPNDGDSFPIPIFALFYLFAAVYFLYALTIEWGIPLGIWAVRWMRNRRERGKVPAPKLPMPLIEHTGGEHE